LASSVLTIFRSALRNVGASSTVNLSAAANRRLVFTLRMLRIKTIISELPNVDFGSFGVAEEHGR